MSSYFRNQIKKLIKTDEQLVLHIDLENIFSSSYESIINKTPENLLKKL